EDRRHRVMTPLHQLKDEVEFFFREILKEPFVQDQQAVFAEPVQDLGYALPSVCRLVAENQQIREAYIARPNSLLASLLSYTAGQVALSASGEALEDNVAVRPDERTGPE